MKKILTTILLLFSFTFYFSQINTDLIKKKVTENPQQNFEPLLEKFKINPADLTQDEMNQLYYGSKFVKNEYSLGDYNRDYDKLWKPASKNLSVNKANKILSEAESKYKRNPLNREVLHSMANIYSALGDKAKLAVVNSQLNSCQKTIANSGDGKTENTAICVIYPGDVISQIDRFSSIDKSKFEQKIKQLPDGSILTMYQMGNEFCFVKLVGGYF